MGRATISVSIACWLAACDFRVAPADEQQGDASTGGEMTLGDSDVDTPIDANLVPDAGTCVTPFSQTQHGCHAALPDTIRHGWNAGRTACQALGGDLVIVNNVAEGAHIVTITNITPIDDRVWLGLSRPSSTSTAWTWVDNTGLTYTQWRAGEPDDSQLCAVIRPTNEWGDLDCAAAYRVVCEK